MMTPKMLQILNQKNFSVTETIFTSHLMESPVTLIQILLALALKQKMKMVLY